MAYLNFAIPSKLEDLLRDSNDYYVKDVIVPKSINENLTKAKQCLKDDGCEFILENFDVFYSILHHEATVSIDVMFQAYTVLHKGMNLLQKSVEFLLGEKGNQSDEEIQKYQNVIKMLTYIYAQTIQVIELKNVTDVKNQGLLKGRKKTTLTNSLFNLDKKGVLLALNNIMQMEICTFWDPPVVEDGYISTVAEVCYKFLDNPSIKSESQVKEEVFNLIGTLVKSYNHSSTFTIRMAQMIKNEEHLTQCAADGIKQLVNRFNCKGLISGLVHELTDWQTDEQYQDNQGARFSSQFLTALAVALPTLMLPEVSYLNQYLGQEPATLRNAVLNVITEVILNVLTKHSLSAEELEFREDFLSILLEHMGDNSAQVRSRVIQHWTRLQEETAIPRHLVNEVLHNVVEYRLLDKATIVRKNAARCITTFLSHNTYSSQMSLAVMKKELEANQAELAALMPEVDEALKFKKDEIEKEWAKCVPEMKQLILEQLQASDDEDDNDPGLNRGQAENLIRMYLKSGKFKEAIQVWKTFEEFDVEDKENTDDIMEEFLMQLKEIYTKSMDNMVEMVTGYLSEEDLKKLEALKEKEQFFKEAVTFLTHIDKAITLMTTLLETTSITDMQEAVTFFTVAYQFNIDNSSYGVAKMLSIMQRNEQDRKDMVTDAFKMIYLMTSTSNMQDHCATIVDRLIKCMHTVSYTNWDNLELIISEWVRKGILDNGVIDMLWRYFTKKQPVSDSISHAAGELLRMAAIGRPSIIARNIKLVTSIAFTERGKNDLSFLSTACNLLALLGRDRIDVESKESPFTINHHDSMWKELFDILLEKFFTLDDYYYPALTSSINLLYKVCGKPQEICERFLVDVLAKLGDVNEIDWFIYVRLCQLLGICAVKFLDFLDETMHKELKRRENCLNSKDKGKKNSTNKSIRSSGKKNGSTLNSTTISGDESTLEGAQAGDEVAESILAVLETKIVTGKSLLAQLAQIVINVCEKPNIFDDVILQGAAVTALIRFMLVSSQFCSQHRQLLFTIFEKTTFPELKESILVHLSDLLTRFPNVIEPWTPRIYARLKDPDLKIRKATFFTLSGLILRDMIRAHSQIHLMVNSLIDDDEGLRSMCRTFFITLSQKEDNLYSLLPDIFSHLMESDISDEHTKDIMKFLFNLMDKAKQMENLVDRFCSKFDGTDNLRQQRNIAHCLSLIQYNEKALNKLQENFEKYKNLVHDPEIYASLKAITDKCNKQQVGKANLKPIVAEIEKLINSVFDMRDDGQSMPPPPRPKTVKKKRYAKKAKRSFDDSED